MGAENFMNASVDSKRSDKRARVLLSAKIQTANGEVDARLRDLSRKGALVECLEIPALGSAVVFVRGKTSVPARVAWVSKDRVGLEFDHMIDEHELLVHVGRPAKAPTPTHFQQQSYKRPALGRGMSVDDRKNAQNWCVAVGLTVPESD